MRPAGSFAPPHGTRVLLCNSGREWGGIQHWMLSLAQALSPRGWTFALAGSPGAEMAHRAAAAGMEMITWPFRRDYDPQTIIIAYRYLRRTRPGLVVLVHGRDLRTVGVAARILGIPVVWRPVAHPHPRIWDRLISLPGVAAVIVPSESARSRLQNVHRIPCRIEVIPQGIDGIHPPTPEEYEAARRHLGWPDDWFVTLFVGRLNDSKGLDTLLHAFARLAPERPTARLILVGSGSEEEALHGLMRSLGLESCVQLVGYVPRPDTYFDACDLLVLPSRWETFGFVLLEAMARAKPIVAAGVGGIPEVVGDHAALLVPPDDPEALARAIRTVADDIDLRIRLGAAGAERVQQHFSLTSVHNRVETLFRDLLSQAVPRDRAPDAGGRDRAREILRGAGHP